MRYVGVSRGPAGEVRQDSEEQVNAGKVEVRQARRERAGYGRVWKVPYWIDQVRQAAKGAIRKGRDGWS